MLDTGLQSETVSAQIDLNAIQHALQHDSEFFINFFLAEELTLPVPVFHKSIFSKMTRKDILRYACAIPRDHAKTTLAKLACVWYFLFSHYRFIVYISNTATIAQSACLDIVTFLESDNFKTVFGGVEWLVRREGDGFYKFKINIGDREKTCILRALGAGQQVRGMNIDNQRPQLAVVDDLEDLENIETEALFLKLKRWFYGTFRKALDKFDNKIIHLGNMVSHRCLLKEHCESEFWHSDRFGAILSNGQVLWPGAFTIEKLKQEFIEYSNAGMAHIWFAEMMNLPIAGGSGLIKSDEIYYKPAVGPADVKFGFITVDPAISSEKWAHKAAVVVHGFVDDTLQAVDYSGEIGVDPWQLFQLIVKMVHKWGITVVGVESNAFQASLQYVFPHYALIAGIEGLTFLPLFSSKRKTERLSAWCGMIKAKEYAITEGDYIMTEQMLMYNPMQRENDDDVIDCAAFAPQMIDQYWSEIVDANRLVTLNINPQGCYDMEAANG